MPKLRIRHPLFTTGRLKLKLFHQGHRVELHLAIKHTL